VIFDAKKNNVRVSTGEFNVSGWENVTINRSLENGAGTFTLQLYDDPPEFVPDINEPITVLIDDMPVITGYIDDRSISISSSSYELSISGRDKTADIIDCNQANPPFVFKNQSLDNVAKRLCNPFNIDVVSHASVSAEIYKSMTINQDQTIFTFLDEYARKRGFLCNSNEQGNLVIFNPKEFENIGNLKEGYNILSLSRKENFSKRYSDYTVKGQSQYSRTIGVAKDDSVKRFRPKVLAIKKQLTNADAIDYAKWSASVSRARGDELEVTIDDWYIDNNLILPGRSVTLDSYTLRIDDEFLIKSVNFSLSNSEYSAVVSLVKPEVFDTDENYEGFKKADKRKRLKRRKI